MFEDIYRGKRVLITGNTGFKGSWLTVWLLRLGADVIGFSKDVPTSPSMFEDLGLETYPAPKPLIPIASEEVHLLAWVMLV